MRTRWIGIALCVLIPIACNAACVWNWYTEESRYREQYGGRRAKSDVILGLANCLGVGAIESLEKGTGGGFPNTLEGETTKYLVAGALQWGGLGLLVGWFMIRPARGQNGTPEAQRPSG